MRRFTNILFSPLGDDDNLPAIRRVIDVARRNDAKLSLLGVVPEPSRLHRLLHRAELDASIESSDRHEMQRRLERWCDAADGIEMGIDVQAGNAAYEIIGQVFSEGHDLVVVTTDEDNEDRACIKRLLRKCPCPVWVIRPTRARIQRVVVAVDPDPDDAELNNMLLELGAGMVDLYGGELHLVHAWELYGESSLRNSPFASVSASRLKELLKNERDSRAHAIDELIASSNVADAPWQIHMLKGPAGHVVPEFVRSKRINLLVMGTVARTGLPGAIMGNTAEQVLDNVNCSVVAIKPSGFVSPLATHR